MTDSWIVQPLVVAAAVTVLAWLVLAIGLVAAYPGRAPVREVLRLLPDVVRLVRRLLTDTRVPRGVRVLLWFLVAYLACPVDVIPDFVPVLGYADDVIVALLAVRRAVRRTDRAVVLECWPGTRDGLDALLRVSGSRLRSEAAPGPADGRR